MSVNLCADQMLMALASNASIVALGPFARDPQISFYADRANSFPQVTGRTEELLNVTADAVTLGPFDNRFMRASLARREIAQVIVDRWSSLNEVRRGVLLFAEQIGEPVNGLRLVNEIDAALASLQRLAKDSPPARFLLLHRRGFIGEGAVVSELLEAAGLQDAAKGATARFMSVEAVVSLQPDYLVVTGRDLRMEDRGLELLEHPALRRLYPAHRRITAPDRLTICAGPSTPELIRHLKAQLEGGVRVR